MVAFFRGKNQGQRDQFDLQLAIQSLKDSDEKQLRQQISLIPRDAKGVNPDLDNQCAIFIQDLCSVKRYDLIRLILQRRSLILWRDNEGNSLLHWASIHGRVKIIADLIAAGHLPNCQNNTGKTAPQLALENNKLWTLKAISNHRQSDSKNVPNIRNLLTKAMWAAIGQSEHKLALKLGLNGAYLKAQHPDTGETLATWLYKQNHIKELTRLLQIKPHALQFTNKDNLTPKQLAEQAGDLKSLHRFEPVRLSGKRAGHWHQPVADYQPEPSRANELLNSAARALSTMPFAGFGSLGGLV